MNDLVIIGAGSFGRTMVREIERINEWYGPTWNLLGVFDEEKTGEVKGAPILGKLEDLLKMESKPYFFVADMDGHVRERIAKRCKEAGFPPATIIGADSFRSVGSEVGEGCYLGYRANLSVKVKLGDYCVVERGTMIGHDTVLGDYSTVRIQASFGGDSNIGKYNDFGIRCTIINMVDTPDNCEFRSGCCVIKHTTVPGVYAGVPAKLIRAYEK